MQTGVREVPGGWFVIRRTGSPAAGEVRAERSQVGLACAACAVPFRHGDQLAAIPLGPGDDLGERARCARGDDYESQTALVHWACATGEG